VISEVKFLHSAATVQSAVAPLSGAMADKVRKPTLERKQLIPLGTFEQKYYEKNI